MSPLDKPITEQRNGTLVDSDGVVVDPITVDEQIEAVVGLSDALEMAIDLLQLRADELSIAPKMVAAWGEKAPKAARRDVVRRERLLKAMTVLKEHQRAINPY
jgi:hypothetical protein